MNTDKEAAMRAYLNGRVLANQTMLILALVIHNLIEVWEIDERICEWWLVSESFSLLLIAEGECVTSKYGLYWWGRRETNQSILLDRVLQRLYQNSANGQQRGRVQSRPVLQQ